jgi:hypothetical protein
MRIILGIVVMTLYSQIAFSQLKHPTDKQELKNVCAKFMDSFRLEKFQAAFDLLKPYSVIEDYKLDTIANTTKEQMKTLSTSYGKIISYEEVSEKEIKNDLTQLNYLLKFQQSFLRFSFILYNNGSGWTVTNLKYNEEIDDLLSSPAKKP